MQHAELNIAIYSRQVEKLHTLKSVFNTSNIVLTENMNFLANWFSRIIIEARHIEYTIFSSLNGSNFYLKLMSFCQQNFKVTMLFFEEKKQLVGQKKSYFLSKQYLKY